MIVALQYHYPHSELWCVLQLVAQTQYVQLSFNGLVSVIGVSPFNVRHQQKPNVRHQRPAAKKKQIWFCLVCKTSRCFAFEQPSAALCRANSCASRNPAHYQAFFFPISQSNYLFWGFSPRACVQRQLQNDSLSDRRRPHVGMTVMSPPPSPAW